MKTPLKNEVEKLSELISNGEYIIGDVHITNHNENTRFVILEKYPEKSNFGESAEMENGIYVKSVYMTVELIKPVQTVEVNFTIDKNGDIEYGV